MRLWGEVCVFCACAGVTVRVHPFRIWTRFSRSTVIYGTLSCILWSMVLRMMFIWHSVFSLRQRSLFDLFVLFCHRYSDNEDSDYAADESASTSSSSKLPRVRDWVMCSCDHRLSFTCTSVKLSLLRSRYRYLASSKHFSREEIESQPPLQPTPPLRAWHRVMQ